MGVGVLRLCRWVKDSRYQGSDIRWLERREEKKSERV
jgi:hypothetical protein